MKKLLVALTMVAFVVALAASALADPGYHAVYKHTASGTWEITDECEMYSKESKSLDYRWESDETVYPCYPDYLPPKPESPVQFDIYNYAHLFPWIETHITETGLIWDIFMHGDFMAKTFIIQLKANCPVLVHLGGGTWDIPTAFVPEDADGYQNGHIEFGPFTKDHDDEMIGDKVRLYSLLRKDGSTSPGTPPDEIELRWWWYVAYGMKPPKHLITPEEFGLMPPKDQWVLARNLNCTEIIVPDSDALHIAGNTHIVFFEDLLVEPCDSEGKYLEVFAITITPDP